MPIDRSASRPDRIVYDSGAGGWSKINANLWRAPNGDAVSVRSMSLDLRIRLGVGGELDTGADRYALDRVRAILDGDRGQL